MEGTAVPANLSSRIVGVGEVTPPVFESMFALYEALFEKARRDVFAADLKAKDWVILLESGEGVVGFSTLQFRPATHRGRALQVLYSGDTVVAQDARRTTALSKAWIRWALALGGGDPGVPLYWLLLAGSYRTYHFLPLFFREYHPRAGAVPEAESRDLLDGLAYAWFGGRYDRRRGIVTIPGAPAIRQGVADVTPARERDEHTAFFLERNPNFASGDELACLCEISTTNLTAAGRRMLR